MHIKEVFLVCLFGYFLRGEKATEVDIPSGRRFTGKGEKMG